MVFDAAAWATDAGFTLADGSVIRNVERGTIRAGSGNDTAIFDFSAAAIYFE